MPKQKKMTEEAHKKDSRAYNSAVRQKQAEDTRNRIADAAEELIRDNGYENTTIEAIARKAGVAPQTVYAVFHSKRGILMRLLKRSTQDSGMEADYKKLVHQPSLADMAREIAAMAARQAGKNISAINTLGGMEVIFPELAEMAKEADEFRRAHILNGVKEALAVHGIQCSPLQEKVLTDIFWAFTDTKLYYMLVSQSGWPEERYEFLLRKVLETVMREVAPEMLKAMRT